MVAFLGSAERDSATAEQKCRRAFRVVCSHARKIVHVAAMTASPAAQKASTRLLRKSGRFLSRRSDANPGAIDFRRSIRPARPSKKWRTFRKRRGAVSGRRFILFSERKKS